MRVSIKNFDVEMVLKNNGVEFEVYDHENHLGDVILTKTSVIWCKGRTRRENGKKFSWGQFIERMEQENN